MATPLTPKAVAPAPPPRVPPPTPCTPEGRQAEDFDVPPVPVVAAAVLQKQALEKAGVLVYDPIADYALAGPSAAPARPKSARPAVKTNNSSPTRGPPSNVAARLRVPLNTTQTTSDSSSKVLTPIRSALRPVPGKENASNVKVKIRAIESRNTPSIANAASVSTTNAAPKPKIGENASPMKSGLRMKDRNRMQENISEKVAAPPKGKRERPNQPGENDSVLAPKRSFIKKSTFSLPQIVVHTDCVI